MRNQLELRERLYPFIELMHVNQSYRQTAQNLSLNWLEEEMMVEGVLSSDCLMKAALEQVLEDIVSTHGLD